MNNRNIELLRQNYKLAVSQSQVQDLFTILIVRPIAAVFVVIFKNLGLTPNIITALGLILQALSLFILIEYKLYTWAGFGIFITYVMDCADGQLARVDNRVSEFGIHFDLFADYIKESTLILVLIYLSLGNGIMPLIYSLVFFIIMSSFFADWIKKSLGGNKSESINKSFYSSFKKKFKIQFWNIGIRNLVYIISISTGNLILIPYYVLSIGSLMTMQKFIRLFIQLRKKK